MRENLGCYRKLSSPTSKAVVEEHHPFCDAKVGCALKTTSPSVSQRMGGMQFPVSFDGAHVQVAKEREANQPPGLYVPFEEVAQQNGPRDLRIALIQHWQLLNPALASSV